MKIEFIKDHPAGIKKGLVTIARTERWGKKMIEEGYAKEHIAKATKTKQEKENLNTKSKKKTK